METQYITDNIKDMAQNQKLKAAEETTAKEIKEQNAYNEKLETGKLTINKDMMKDANVANMKLLQNGMSTFSNLFNYQYPDAFLPIVEKCKTSFISMQTELKDSFENKETLPDTFAKEFSDIYQCYLLRNYLKDPQIKKSLESIPNFSTENAQNFFDTLTRTCLPNGEPQVDLKNVHALNQFFSLPLKDTKHITNNSQLNEKLREKFNASLQNEQKVEMKEEIKAQQLEPEKKLDNTNLRIFINKNNAYSVITSFKNAGELNPHYVDKKPFAAILEKGKVAYDNIMSALNDYEKGEPLPDTFDKNLTVYSDYRMFVHCVNGLQKQGQEILSDFPKEKALELFDTIANVRHPNSDILTGIKNVNDIKNIVDHSFVNAIRLQENEGFKAKMMDVMGPFVKQIEKPVVVEVKEEPIAPKLSDAELYNQASVPIKELEKSYKDYYNELVRLTNSLKKTDSVFSNDTEPYKKLHDYLETATKELAQLKDGNSYDFNLKLNEHLEKINEKCQAYKDTHSQLKGLSSRQVQRIKVMNRLQTLKMRKERGVLNPNEVDYMLGDKLAHGYLINKMKGKDGEQYIPLYCNANKIDETAISLTNSHPMQQAHGHRLNDKQKHDALFIPCDTLYKNGAKVLSMDHEQYKKLNIEANIQAFLSYEPKKVNAGPEIKEKKEPQNEVQKQKEEKHIGKSN